jgi:hypothetical protein
MTRRLLIAATAVLTISGISLFTTRASARDSHPRYVHVTPRDHFAAWRRSASPREADIHHAVRVRALHASARHFQPPHHEVYRR